MRDDSLARQAVDCFGWKYQFVKIVQELSEAAAEGTKIIETFFNSNKGGRDYNEAVERFIREFGDVKNISPQVEEIFGRERIDRAEAEAQQKLRGIIDAARNSGQIA